MIAVNELIKQSPEKSIRWTIADRSGADAYASSQVADQEMRKTSRRFRGAAWLAFSVLQPAQAFAKVDPLKLRLASFQRELSDESLFKKMEHILISGASRGGVDANHAPQSWLQRLPGMTAEAAAAIDARRREQRLTSREAILELGVWDDVVSSRQAIPFLRVFGSDESLDGTLIHPDDYVLAKKLAKALEIELPPDSPPGYEPLDLNESDASSVAAKGLAEATPEPSQPAVEEFTTTGADETSFAVDLVNASNETDPSANAGGEQGGETTTAVQDPVPEESATTETPAEDATPVDSESSLEGNSTTKQEGESQPTAETPDAEPNPSAEPTPDSSSGTSDQPTVSVKRPRPDQAKLDKCVKEWQVGAQRVNQLVSWLCDPFGDSDESDSSHAVMSTMPSLKSLKNGDEVIGVVVGVMPFGVFVELAPDCSGLIHVSKVSESFVEDLHEALQVGDVVTTWVTGVDEKRKRVALSAISPQREAEIAQSRSERASGSPRGRGGKGGQASHQRGASRGKPAGGGRQGDGKSAGSANSRGGQSGPGKGGPRGGRDSRGGKGGRGRDSRGSRKPESYRAVSKPEAKPISEAMQAGAEPLRSFGDLLQFFDKDKKTPTKQVPEKTHKAAKPEPDENETTSPESTSPESTEPSQDVSTPESEPTAPLESTAPDQNAPESSDSANSGPPSS